MTTRRNRGSWILVAGVLLTGPACAGHGARADAETAWPAAAGVHVSVNNHYGFPVTVYAVGSGISFRLGTVLPEMVSVFGLPPGMVGNGPVEFLASGDGSARAESGRFLLAPGDVVDFVISRPMYASTATVRSLKTKP